MALFDDSSESFARCVQLALAEKAAGERIMKVQVKLLSRPENDGDQLTTKLPLWGNLYGKRIGPVEQTCWVRVNLYDLLKLHRDVQDGISLL
jgi:hypothetical protein